MERKEVTVTAFHYIEDNPKPGIDFCDIPVTFDKEVPPNTILYYDDMGERLYTKDEPAKVFEEVGYTSLAKFITNRGDASFPVDKLYVGMKYYYYD